MLQNAERKKTILVVDDAPENIDVIKAIVTPEYSMMATVNGRTALEIAERKKPDLILLDVVMSGMNGYEICQKLKANPLTAHIPVLFLTTLTDKDNERLGFSVGAVGYVNRPFQPEQLRAQIHKYLKY